MWMFYTGIESEWRRPRKRDAESIAKREGDGEGLREEESEKEARKREKVNSEPNATISQHQAYANSTKKQSHKSRLECHQKKERRNYSVSYVFFSLHSVFLVLFVFVCVCRCCCVVVCLIMHLSHAHTWMANERAHTVQEKRGKEEKENRWRIRRRRQGRNKEKNYIGHCAFYYYYFSAETTTTLSLWLCVSLSSFVASRLCLVQFSSTNKLYVVLCALCTRICSHWIFRWTSMCRRRRRRRRHHGLGSSVCSFARSNRFYAIQ